MGLSQLLSRAVEMYERSDYSVTSTSFMSPGEKTELYKELIARIGNGISRCFFWGGSRGAERCSAVFLPEWMDYESSPDHHMPLDEERTQWFAEFLEKEESITDDIGITPLSVRGSGFRNLTHRDFMGSILGLGITRDVVGDIVVTSESEAVVFVSSKISEYLCSELTKVGRDAVITERLNISPLFEIQRKYDSYHVIVSSMRLDCVVKAITGKSREISADMIRQGMVELSYAKIIYVDKNVCEGDIVSISGYGKYVIGSNEGNTHSGKIRLSIKKYI